MWSYARQRKYNFCPRAFYFLYQDLPKDILSPEIENQIIDLRRSYFLHFSRKYLLAQLVKDVFYLRPETLFDLKKHVFRNVKKFDLNDSEIENLLDSLSEFFESKFYCETSPALVSHVEIEESPSIAISDVQVLGSVHLAWISELGKFNILKISKSEKYLENTFPALYAMKKFQVSPEKLNAGCLNPVDWTCHWNSINWHDVSELQERALSFIDSESFSDYPATEQISRCDICEFSELCYSNSRELDSL